MVRPEYSRDALPTINSDTMWYPISVDTYREHIGIVIKKNEKFNKARTKNMLDNIAYSLQYIEFLIRSQKDIKLSSVLNKLSNKAIIVTSVSIIECLLHYLVVSNSKSIKPEEPQILGTSRTKNFKISGEENVYGVVEMFLKSKNPRITKNNLEKNIEIATKEKYLGKNFKFYKELDELRDLRNNIHLHLFDKTDYHRFKEDVLKKSNKVLYDTLTSKPFNNCKEPEELFYFLKGL